jgi:enamine deaminase RidA (YjgF/YER057c/UK114 family)
MKATGSRSRGTEYVHPSLAAAHAKFHVPSALELDGWVYLTGVIAAKAPEDNGDLTPAFTRAFRQIAEVLQLAGCSWDDVVKITSYHLNVHEEIPVMAAVKDRYCGAPYPAWSVVGVASLANPAGVCEIDVIARKGTGI